MENENLISTAIPNPVNDADLYHLVPRHQKHSCTNYCFRGNSDSCRFGYPKPMMETTHIDPDTRKVNYKRTLYDDRITNYNPYLLKLIRASMDIQINNDENVLFYLAKYLTKMDDVENMTINEDSNRIARQHFCGRVIGSVEAVYDILALHKHRSSRGVVYIDTSLPGVDQRRQLVHNFAELDPNSIDIFVKTHVEKYERRHFDLDHINMTQYMTNYRVISEKGGNDELDLDLDQEEAFVTRHDNVRQGRERRENLGIVPRTNTDQDNRRYNLRVHADRLPLWRTHEYTARDGEKFYYQLIVLHHPSFNFNRERNERTWQQFFNAIRHNLNFEEEGYLQTIEAQEEAIRMEAAGREAAGRAQELTLDQMLQQASPAQAGFYHNVMSGELHGLCLVSGGGGVGKSFLLRMLDLGLRQVHNVTVVKLAPTGIAAQNIGGQTIHRFFGMSNVVSVPNPIRLDDFFKTNANVVFLIDEVSMISSELFNIINNAMVRATNTQGWFGGILCIFFGDFAQLTPVQMQTEGLFLDHPAFDSIFIKALTVNQRVLGGQNRLVRFLRDIRLNIMTSPLVRDIIPARWFDAADIPLEVTRLFTRNDSVELYTTQCLGDQDITTYRSIDFSAHNVRQLNALNETNLVQELNLRVGVPVILLHNVNVEQGWVNGSFCTVVALHENRIVIQKQSTGEQMAVERITRSVYNTAYARTQFPLRLAYALTIHRVQSLTLDRVAICMDYPFLSHGQFYTACSRVTNLEGLFFFGQDKSHVVITSNEKCLDFVRQTEAIRR